MALDWGSFIIGAFIGATIILIIEEHRMSKLEKKIRAKIHRELIPRAFD